MPIWGGKFSDTAGLSSIAVTKMSMEQSPELNSARSFLDQMKRQNEQGKSLLPVTVMAVRAIMSIKMIRSKAFSRHNIATCFLVWFYSDALNLFSPQMSVLEFHLEWKHFYNLHRGILHSHLFLSSTIVSLQKPKQLKPQDLFGFYFYFFLQVRNKKRW